MTATIQLGFEVGSGEPISVPLGHTVVCGQTQLSGKTSTLEAMVERSKLRAVAFVTKRFEGAFSVGRRIAPYFRERTDWRFVASLLEATMSERMRRERPWIVKVTKNTDSLAEVHSNVRKSLAKAKGYALDMYTMLDEYLKIAVEDLGCTQFATTVELHEGLNVMDLSGLRLQTQSLVIASVLEWMYEHERDTVTIIPEAWEFLPLQRQSPVLLAAEQLIRKGAAGGNFVWLDSQDLAGVAAAVRKMVAVYLIGVQREENEVRRMLAHISGAKKPSRDDIMALELGHFYACWRGHAHHVYVQPKWLSESDARDVAMGRKQPKPIKQKPTRGDDKMPTAKEIAAELLQMMHGSEAAGQLQPGNTGRTDSAKSTRSESHSTPKPAPPVAPINGQPDLDALAEALFPRVLDRVLADPAILKVCAGQTEIEVTKTRKVIQADGDSLRGRIALLIVDGFFDEGKDSPSVVRELRRLGATEDVKFNTAKELASLNALGFFTREGNTKGTKYTALPGMKINIVEA